MVRMSAGPIDEAAFIAEQAAKLAIILRQAATEVDLRTVTREVFMSALRPILTEVKVLEVLIWGKGLSESEINRCNAALDAAAELAVDTVLAEVKP